VASNGFQPGGQGIPAFPEEDAPQLGADNEEVARFAAFRGNTLRGTTAEMNAFEFPVEGLWWSNTTNGGLYRFTSGAWVLPDAYATAEGFVYVSTTAGVVVSFPAGRFTQAPLVFATPQDPSLVLVPHISDRTATSFRLRVYTLAGAATTANCAWMARQRTPTGVGG